MPRCEFCGRKVSLPFHCQYCGKNFCDDHRLPPNHDCAGLAAWKKTPAPGVGIRYGAGGASAYGGGYAAKPEKKKPGPIPFRKHPYFRIAVVLAVLLLMVILFLIFGGNAATMSQPQTTASSHVLSAPPMAMPPPLPATTSNTTPSGTAANSTPSPAPPPAVHTVVPSEITPAATMTPPFQPVPGNVTDDPYPVSTLMLASRIHELVNTQRTADGIAPLSLDPALTALALNHSADMAVNEYFSHVSPAGEDPTARGNASGILCIKNYGSYYTYGIAENIFQNNLYTSVTYTKGVYSYAWSTQEAIAQSTVTGWMNSPGHRKNILTSSFGSEGIGIAVGSDDKVYITEDFC